MQPIPITFNIFLLNFFKRTESALLGIVQTKSHIKGLTSGVHNQHKYTAIDEDQPSVIHVPSYGDGITSLFWSSYG